MPNWCQNVARINHDNPEMVVKFKAEIDKDNEKLFEHFLPNPSGEWDYDWSVSNWGTKWDVSPREYYINDQGALYISFDSAWGPPIAFYEFLYDEGYRVEAFYNEEGMAFCGHFIDGSSVDYEYGDLSADEIESTLPDELDELFYISGMQRDREWEEEEDEDDDSHLERTEWFDGKIKPVHVGTYEITTIAWPFPQKIEWDGKKWFNHKSKDVVQWRGITEQEHNSLVRLEQLKKEFDDLVATERKE